MTPNRRALIGAIHSLGDTRAVSDVKIIPIFYEDNPEKDRDRDKNDNS